MNKVFAPGCALVIYKPHIAEKLHKLLCETEGEMEQYLTCCHHQPPSDLPKPTEIINVCSGCDRRYSTLYEGISTVSLWKILAKNETFPFPDYKGAEISVHDACPTRKKSDVHSAVRTLLKKMNFTIVEPKLTGTSAICCGDSFHTKISKEEVLEKMNERAAQMPVDDVAVYCVSCIKSMKNGGKNPRFLLDLLFNEATDAGETDPDKWHDSVNEFMAAH